MPHETAVPRWSPGTPILWRYRANGTRGDEGIHICRPMTVVEDTGDRLVAWLAPGTECVRPVFADGTPVHAEPLASRYTRPRTTGREPWWGNGVLKLARAGEPWSVWLWWDEEWTFRNWYVNLEQPLRRHPGGVDSVDHFLDIDVQRDRSWSWRDEDEFAQACADGLMSAETAAGVREAGRAAVALIAAWGAPFSEPWAEWRPEPSWPVPSLPADWDRLPAGVTA
ncbi:DUF402 domain-containing protein [Streptomyces sp. NPDC006684]|uniref:cytidylyl-2-hydroxypropylphosphonate hydrolase n=1 Tax=Streptomyces sp. NPDC006684 TaxID=3154477 RepID=UPI0034565B5D